MYLAGDADILAMSPGQDFTVNIPRHYPYGSNFDQGHPQETNQPQRELAGSNEALH